MMSFRLAYCLSLLCYYVQSGILEMTYLVNFIQ